MWDIFACNPQRKLHQLDDSSNINEFIRTVLNFFFVFLRKISYAQKAPKSTKKRREHQKHKNYQKVPKAQKPEKPQKRNVLNTDVPINHFRYV